MENLTNALTFDQLPKAVTMLTNEVSELKRLLIKKQEQAPTEPTERLLTVKETAQFLNLTVPTIYSKVSRGEIPYMKRSKRLYFSSTEIMEYLKEGTVKSSAQIDEQADAYLSEKRKGRNNG